MLNMMGLELDTLIKRLQSYFAGRRDVAFAFLFGSYAKGLQRDVSDLDVGVYFFPKGELWELEEDIEYPEETNIWGDIDALAGKEIDLIVLNRASARLVYTILTEGVPLVVHSPSLCWKILLQAGRLVEEYLDFTVSYIEVKNRSTSLSALDKERIIRILDFLKSELRDAPQFVSITYEEYTIQPSLRRNLERWVENLVNASLDIAKILLASEKQPLPQTYRETLKRLQTLPGFQGEWAEKLADNTRLRNILAHEYLDIRFRYLVEFASSAEMVYSKLMEAAHQFVYHQD